MGKKKIEISGQLTLWEFMAQPFHIRKPVRLIELFGGIGSQAMAFKELGVPFEHYRLVEFDKYPVASYNAIHGTNFEPVDIRQMRGADLGIVEPWNYTYFLTYSFPCQDLSVAGKGAGMAKGSGTRSGLLWEVERLLNETEILPQVLLMENVPQVHGKKNMPDFQKWLDFLSGKGYQNFWQDLNAKDFGVAQNRIRCFCVSILGGGNFSFPESVPLTKVMNDYLENEVDEKYYLRGEKVKNLVDSLITSGRILQTDRQTDRQADRQRASVDLSISQPGTITTANCVTAKDYGISNRGRTGNGIVEWERGCVQPGNGGGDHASGEGL